ncbi:CoA ester lyase [Saccharopolyspora sp. K220]|uniref:HpcH/HpaI aldolase/citrate lyase family protein n=1 Tax=Saccharopolyspora soli TaxID=2926618 RepID=UPI001F572B16|nr:CoA ester lyase [Saccharopolyspora soli]MCI2420206.1 CoA ester lyase [Saccharopolyspora soli]
MTTPITWLYVPGDRPDRFERAAASGADVVIIDLEDAVDVSRKDQARDNAVAHLAGTRGGPEVHVRINDLATQRGRADLAAFADVAGLAGVRLPKVESPTDLDVLDEVFGDRAMPAFPLLESARGLANAHAIAAHPRTAGIALGEQDLLAELSIDEAALDQLRLQVVVAAAAAGLGPVPMSVYANVRDEAGLLDSCRRGRSLGLFGRTAIHPSQIPLIRKAFRPTEAEISRARDVVEAAARAEVDGVGALVLPDGRFVDAPIVAKARRVLALAEEISQHPR